METAVPSYLSLEHKQALASNVIPVNMQESDEKRGAGWIPRSLHTVWMVSVWISGLVPDGLDPRSLSRGVFRSCTWGETQLLLFLLVHGVPLLS